MLSIALLGELGIRFILVSKYKKKTFESDVGNVLKEFETFIFDESLMNACYSTVTMYKETHFRSSELYHL